ncbi:YhgE/Pip domain-containing protein [Alicyclobacillus acidocaldarius]|uniref:YhgE/Pip C-terminal domain protein n=1 Tax=Alicyclobacillus acidocaldarius subsp. acidocaldarius (strain ATCC 27009 / DSM 446 / BCRC 14685 / JCM 5260 / KCTC 1825 / NBRC 15652 / NCIMB 11725 / NRRL B-14509 / 104-IA) TaxID=521098 RepID=C8WQ42_ALIAD|nr:YhgE/Pip domain-containing protein [Alicyclobacillus acidocaldarius]ACV57146.1 YhgE/Pip C-terminal domain protein [Alicyclobacillus acidocaldarius subsp. acidocaldarius DSM 446]
MASVPEGTARGNVFQEFARLRRPKMMVQAAGIALIPVLYAGAFLWAFWNPYGHLDRLPVAVVNEDAGASFRGERLNAGRDLVEKLRSDHSLGWHFVTPAQASAGMADGAYAMEIVIPRDFSKRAVNRAEHTGAPAPEITSVTNDRYNYIAGVIGRNAAVKLASETALELAKSYTASLVDALESSGTGLHKAAKAADALASGGRELEAKGELLVSGASQLAAGADRLAGGLEQASQGAGALAQGASQAVSGADRLNAGLVRLNQGAESLAQGASSWANQARAFGEAGDKLGEAAQEVGQGASQLAAGAGKLTTSLGQLDTGASHLASGAEALAQNASQFAQAANQTAAGSQQVASGAKQLAEGLQQLAKANPALAETPAFQSLLATSAEVAQGAAQTASANEQLASGAAGLSQGASQLAAGAESLASGLKQAEAGAAPLQQGLQQLAQGASGVAQGGTRLAAASGQLATGASQIAQGAKGLAAGTGAAQQASSSLRGGLVQLQGGAAKLAVGNRALAGGAASLASGAGKLANGLGAYQAGVGKLASGSEALAANLANGASKLQALHGGAVIAAVAHPVSLHQVELGDIQTYGNGFAPYFLSLGLYVGVLMMSVIFPFREPYGEPKSGVAWFFSKWLLVVAIAWAQALIADAVVLGLVGVHTAHPLGFVLFSLFASTTFASILLALVALLDNPGRFLGVVLLILQLTSTSGTYPVSLSPRFFQAVGPWLPMYATVSGFRYLIGGGDPSLMARDLAELAIYTASFIAIGVLLFAGFFRRLGRAEPKTV